MTNTVDWLFAHAAAVVNSHPGRASLVVLLLLVLVLIGILTVVLWISRNWRVGEWGFPWLKFVPRKEANAAAPKKDARVAPSERSSLLPGYYDFEFLKSKLLTQYGHDIGILVVQFGSTGQDRSNLSDEDYLVLVHGRRCDEHATRNYEGSRPKNSAPVFLAGIDIQVVMYDSFWAGIIIGKPFEVSVALKGRLRDAHNIDRRYWEWCTVLVTNAMCDPRHLSDAIAEDIERYKADLRRAVVKREEMQAVVIAYHLSSDYLKRLALKSWPAQACPVSSMYQLSQYKYLADCAPDPVVKDAYVNIAAVFKQNGKSLSWNGFLADVSRIVGHFEGRTVLNA